MEKDGICVGMGRQVDEWMGSVDEWWVGAWVDG